MNAELKAKWIAALRSGEYKQGFYNFERADKFCCLGVLCVVSGLPTMATNGVVGNWSACELVAGLSSDTMDTLSGYNDTGWSFAAIADWIESNIPTEGGGR